MLGNLNALLLSTTATITPILVQPWIHKKPLSSKMHTIVCTLLKSTCLVLVNCLVKYRYTHIHIYILHHHIDVDPGGLVETRDISERSFAFYLIQHSPRYHFFQLVITDP
jgi:membrane protein YdbS with pleckstrin-like domain